MRATPSCTKKNIKIMYIETKHLAGNLGSTMGTRDNTHTLCLCGIAWNIEAALYQRRRRVHEVLSKGDFTSLSSLFPVPFSLLFSLFYVFFFSAWHSLWKGNNSVKPPTDNTRKSAHKSLTHTRTHTHRYTRIHMQVVDHNGHSGK